ncbi:MAG TPA: AMIN domain-containing protein [Gemmatimonadaceae bacterium]
MIRVWTLALTLAAALRGGDGTVSSLAVTPAAGRAEVIIGVEGAVEVQDFTLRGPDKIVIDISGATLGLPASGYDRIERGGIVDVRYSQYRRNVVRVVLTLDRQRTYTVSKGAKDVRIAVQADSGRTFTAWHAVAERPEAVADAADRAPEPAPAPAARQSGATRQDVREVAMEEPVADARTTMRAQQRSQQPRITVAWQNADIRDVIAAFAAFSGRTIIVGKGVTATVTAEINDQPWDVALQAILASQGLGATEDASGIIVVDTYENLRNRMASEPLVTRTIRLNYSRANTVAPNLQQRLSRDCSRSAQGQGGTIAAGGQPIQPNQVVDLSCPTRGAVTFDTLTNSVSVTDVPSNLSVLEQYARTLDVRQPQVSIKAKIILVDRTNLEGLGLKYDLGSNRQYFNQLAPRIDPTTGQPEAGNGQIFLGGNAISAIGNASQSVPAAALRLVYSTALGAYDFTTFLEALQEVSLLDVQSEPSVVTLNNRMATLKAGTEVPIRVVEAQAGGNSSGFPRATVQLRQTGIVLNVTPSITNNRQIQMRVHAENSSVQFQSGDVGAVFPTQSVDNELLVADGETAVMGGLTTTSVTITKTGIPLLVDLPLVGRLFGVTNRSETKRDLLILITPHIVDEGETLPTPDPRRDR